MCLRRNNRVDSGDADGSRAARRTETQVRGHNKSSIHYTCTITVALDTVGGHFHLLKKINLHHYLTVFSVSLHQILMELEVIRPAAVDTGDDVIAGHLGRLAPPRRVVTFQDRPSVIQEPPRYDELDDNDDVDGNDNAGDEDNNDDMYDDIDNDRFSAQSDGARSRQYDDLGHLTRSREHQPPAGGSRSRQYTADTRSSQRTFGFSLKGGAPIFRPLLSRSERYFGDRHSGERHSGDRHSSVRHSGGGSSELSAAQSSHISAAATSRGSHPEEDPSPQPSPPPYNETPPPAYSFLFPDA